MTLTIQFTSDSANTYLDESSGLTIIPGEDTTTLELQDPGRRVTVSTRELLACLALLQHFTQQPE